MRLHILKIVAGVAVLAGAFLIGRQTSSPSVTTTSATPSTTITVPVLKEHFTLLACNQSTTIGLEGCAEHQIVALDAQINALRRHVFTSLTSTSARRNFVDAEVSWSAYRSSLCLSESSVYQGGTLAPVAYATCVVQGDRRHVVALREFEHQLSHP
ncbi:MAG: lysozyme inhibitor LprI family protein [Acidimicrobiales bacterium]